MNYNIKIKVRELIDNGDWEHTCKIKGINIRSVNEGLIDTEDEICLTNIEAKEIGII